MSTTLHPNLILIQESGILSAKQFEVAQFFYEFSNMTPNEVMEEVKKKHPDRNHLELTGINKYPSILKERNILKVSEERKCRITGNKAQALIPTYEMPLKKGQKIIDEKYIDLGEQSIDGGMGVVKFVLCKKTGRKVAMKICKDQQLLVRFKPEVQLLLKLQHLPQIINIIDYNLDKAPYYFTMPIAPSGDAMKLIPLLNSNIQLQNQIFNSMMDCIEAIHKENCLHRDIKPQNFLVFENFKIIAIDMGVAKDLNDDGKTRVTHTQAPGGTEEYAPPEFYEPGGFKYSDQTWDIYSLGKTFYRLLTGKNARFLKKENIPTPIFNVLQKACHSEKFHRYDSITSLRRALNHAYDTILQQGNLTLHPTFNETDSAKTYQVSF